MQNFVDIASERSLVGSLLVGGAEAFSNICDIVSAEDFTTPVNRCIFHCMNALSEDNSIFDPGLIQLTAKSLGFSQILDSFNGDEYLILLKDASVYDPVQTQKIAAKIRKLSIFRKLYKNCEITSKYLSECSPETKLSEVIETIDTNLTDVINGVDGDHGLNKIAEMLPSYIEQILSEEEVTSPGLSFGFKNYETAIGGGFRPGTLNTIVARMKTGKSFLAANIAIQISQQNIPVLVLDSEMTEDLQNSRLISIYAGIPMIDIDTRSVNKDMAKRNKLVEAAKTITSLPLFYRSISGLSPEEVIMSIKSWLYKHVGFDENGKANPCLVVYDYLKLTSGDGLAGHTPEYILLGLIMTKLNAFVLKYNIPMTIFCQANRDGINTEDTSVLAGSDRIGWLCSNLSILKNKNDIDTDLGCGFVYGNKKIVVLEARSGPGLNQDDYINVVASLKPGVPLSEANGRISEGILFSQRDVLGEEQD